MMNLPSITCESRERITSDSSSGDNHSRSGTLRVEAIPVARPLLPKFDKLEPYLREIDANRFYANQGALHERFKARLCAHFSIAPDEIAISSSGTAALITAILGTVGYAKADGPKLCVCPSYSFVATAIAIRTCGYTPCFVDVDRESWAVDPARLPHMVDLASVALVLTVAPYGRPIDVDAWNNFQRDFRLPVIVDGAACFDTVDAAAVARSRMAVCISLHATKTLSTAEGGLVVGPPDIVHGACCASNFGFDTARESVGPGSNSKLSEYHAAIGLAELDAWPGKRQAFIRAASHYRKAADETGLGEKIHVSTAAAAPYALFHARDPSEAERVEDALARQDIDCRLWYARGIHTQPEFRDCPAGPLPVTEYLGRCLIGLPFAVDLTADEAARVAETIKTAMSE